MSTYEPTYCADSVNCAMRLYCRKSPFMVETRQEVRTQHMMNTVFCPHFNWREYTTSVTSSRKKGAWEDDDTDDS